MIANHIQDALVQVKELQNKILEKQRFKGYSGRAKALSGTIALIVAAIMAISYYPKTVSAHIFGWGIVFVLAFILNYGALFHWFLFDKNVKRDFRKLRPTIDVFPALFVGGILTWCFIQSDQVHLLFGMWMCLYGLMSLANRHVLPRLYWIIGVFYLVCGTVFLLLSDTLFLNPWPMGFVFFIGEWLGAIILHFEDNLIQHIKNGFGLFEKIKEKKYVP